MVASSPREADFKLKYRLKLLVLVAFDPLSKSKPLMEMSFEFGNVSLVNRTYELNLSRGVFECSEASQS